MEVHFLEDHEANPQVQFLAFHLERRRISCSANVPSAVYNAPEGAYGDREQAVITKIDGAGTTFSAL